MSVIQKIRDKYIGLVIVAIVLALVGFLVMDAMQSNVRGLFGDDQTLMAEVNGARIEYKSYEQLRMKYEENMKSRSKDGTLSDMERSQIMDQVWNDVVGETLMTAEMEKLGIDLTDKELQDMLTGPFADPMVQQNFRDPNTGIFDPSRVSQFLNSLSQDKTGQQRAQWKDFEDALIKSRKMTKYTDLISKGIYIPKFMLDDMAKQRTATSAISYVQLPYTLIADNAVKVSDEDIKKFMEKNDAMFRSQEATAKVEYVAFDIIPSSADTAESLGALNTIKADFETTIEHEEFVAKNSEESMKDIYYTEKTLEVPVPAEVLAAGVNSVTGPVYFNGYYKLIKILDKKSMPDSVKASHILVGIGENRTEAQAQATIDSLQQMINGGADFGQLAASRSDDQGSAQKGGDLGYFTQGMMVPEFNDACFNGTTGEIKQVKTQFGIHLIKITDQKNFNPAVKIAVVSKALQAGTATTQAAFTKASEFAATAKDAKTFTDAAKKMGKDKRVAENLTKTQQQIQGLGSARELTRWAFEAKPGSISPIYTLDDKYVIAVAVSRQEKGTLPDIASVRPQIENQLKREKKGQMLADQYKGKGLADIAAAAKVEVKNADTVLMMGGGNTEIGFEPKVIGAAFNKSLVNKVSPGIPGEQGVYFITVKSMNEGVAGPNPMVEMERMQMQMQIASQAQQMINYVLKKNAKITDNRSNFY